MGLDWGRAGGGAVTGAAAGSMFGVPGAAIGGIAGGLLGMFGSKGEEAKPGGINYKWLQNPQYSFTEPRMRLTSDFITQQMERMQRGEMPAWYDKIAPQMRQQMQQGLSEQYQGGAFGPGVLGAQEAYGVKRGLGRGSAAGGAYGGQLQKWTQQSGDIDKFIAQMGAQAQQRGSEAFPQLSMQMREGPSGQWGASPYGPTPYQPSGSDQILGAMGQFGGMTGGMGNLAGLFGGGQGGQVNTAGGGSMTEPNYGGFLGFGGGPAQTGSAYSTTTPF